MRCYGRQGQEEISYYSWVIPDTPAQVEYDTKRGDRIVPEFWVPSASQRLKPATAISRPPECLVRFLFYETCVLYPFNTNLVFHHRTPDDYPVIIRVMLLLKFDCHFSS